MSEAKGYLRVPIWVDDGVVKPLVNDNGRVPVQLEGSDPTLDINIKSSEIDVPVSLDAQDITIDINLKSSDITLGVTESSPLTLIQARSHGWNLSNWRKNAMAWGYSNVWEDSIVSSTLPAGDSYVDGTEVAAGYVVRVMGASFYVTSGTITEARLRPEIGAVNHVIYVWKPPANNVYYTYTGEWVMKSGDYVRFQVFTATLNDNIGAHFWGYQMKIDE